MEESSPIVGIARKRRPKIVAFETVAVPTLDRLGVIFSPLILATIVTLSYLGFRRPLQPGEVRSGGGFVAGLWLLAGFAQFLVLISVL